MAIARELGQARSPLKKLAAFPWWTLTKAGFGFCFISVVMSQCVSLSVLSKNSQNPPVIQVGQDRMLVEVEELPELENQKAFIQDALESMLSSSPWVPKELDAKCAKDPSCEQARGQDKEAFGHQVPVMQAFASYLTSVEYQPAFVKMAIANKPEGYNQGESSVYRVGYVSDPEPVSGKAGTYRVVVRGATYIYDANLNPVKGVRDNRLVTFREAAKPSGRPKTLIEKEVSKIRSRGYEITLIQPIIDQEIKQ